MAVPVVFGDALNNVFGSIGPEGTEYLRNPPALINLTEKGQSPYLAGVWERQQNIFLTGSSLISTPTVLFV